MKIGLIASNWRPIPGGKDNIFAPGIIILALADGLVERGHEVTLFAPKNTKTKAKLISEGLNSAYDDYQKEWRQDLATFLQIEQEYEMVILSRAFEMAKDGEFDVVHVHKTNIEPFFANFIPCPMIVTSHHSYLKAKAPIFSKADEIRIKKYRNTCYFTAHSHFMKNQISLNFAGVVYNGVDLNKYEFNSRGGENLLYVGRMIESKGPDIALEVAEKANKKLEIVGDIRVGKKNVIFWRKLKSKISRSKYGKYVGFVSSNLVSRYYQNAKVLIFSIREGEAFGLVMIEAMASGTPVVAFGRGAVPEVIKDGETGFIIKPGDINGMVKAVKKIYAMPETECRQMRRACREHVEKNFTVEKMVDGYERVYKKVIADWQRKHQ